MPEPGLAGADDGLDAVGDLQLGENVGATGLYEAPLYLFWGYLLILFRFLMA